MIGNRIELYRRHGEKCPYRAQGASWQRCECPVWGCGIINGRKFQASLKTRSWSRAEDRARRICDGELVEEKGVALATAVKAYLADCEYRQIGPATLAGYRRILEFHLCGAIGQEELKGITTEQVARVLQSRKVENSKVKPRTARKELGYVRTFFNWCVARGMIDRSPARAIRPPKKPKIHANPCTAPEVQRLLAAIPSIGGPNPIARNICQRRVKAALLLMLWSGLRVSDVAGFRRDAIDRHGRMTVRSRKTDVQLRIQLPPEVLGALRSLPRVSDTYWFWHGNGPLKTLTQLIWRSMKALERQTGILVHPHRFRDTFACRLLERGVDLRTVSLLLGHDSIKTTEDHYAAWVAAHQKLLDDALSLLDYKAG